MLISVKFGETHAVAQEGDTYKGKTTIRLVCGPEILIEEVNKDRFVLINSESRRATCVECRKRLGESDEEPGDKEAPIADSVKRATDGNSQAV